MQQIVNINGFETIIEIPQGQVLSPVITQSDKDNYRIEYSNGLVEVGGTVEIEAVPSNGYIEGSLSIDLPFTNTLTIQVTALAISSAVQENAHISETETGFKIWAYANTTTPSTIKVKWSAKGIIGDYNEVFQI